MEVDPPPGWAADGETFVSPARSIPEASRADALLASLATLLRTLRQLAADSLPAGFALPSPFAPLLLDSHAAQR